MLFLTREYNNVEWKRPKDICDDPQFFTEGATRFDINQVTD